MRLPSPPRTLAYALTSFPWQAGDEEKNEVMLEIGEFMLLAILGDVTVLGEFFAITRRVPHQQAGFPAATLAATLAIAAIAAAIATASVPRRSRPRRSRPRRSRPRRRPAFYHHLCRWLFITPKFGCLSPH